MPEPIYFFWGIVALLAVAAACNHGRHHARDARPATRLERAAHRAGDVARPVARAVSPTVEPDPPVQG